MFRLAGALAILVAASATAPASADIYWSNEASGTVARSNDAGTVVDPSYITGATSPRGVAINGTYIYWAHDGSAGISGNIGRAPLDQTSPPNQAFLTTAAPPQGVAVDNVRVYWTQPHPSDPTQQGSVAASPLSGLSISDPFVRTGTSPCGVASNADDIYWGNGGTPGSIGSSHGVFSVLQTFITATSDPCGVAQSGGSIYWANTDANTIGVANQNGSNPRTLIADTGASSVPCGVAVAGDHIYWTNRGTDTIARADLDGDNQQDSFISGAGVQDPCGIAVTPTVAPQPAEMGFAATGTGAASDIASFYVANTGSSVVGFSGSTLAGADSEEFEILADGCATTSAPPGLGCIVNARFTPTTAGEKHAVLRVTSSVGSSPTDIPLSGRAVAPSPPDPPAYPSPKEHARTLSIERAANGKGLKGALASDDPSCVADQPLKLFKRRRASDRKLETTSTNEAGGWRVRTVKAKGHIYAAIARSQPDANAICLAASSEAVRIKRR